MVARQADEKKKTSNILKTHFTKYTDTPNTQIHNNT